MDLESQFIRGKEYIRAKLYEPAGLRQGVVGLWVKTIPNMLGSLSTVTSIRIVQLLVYVILLIPSALWPILVQRAYFIRGRLDSANDVGADFAATIFSVGGWEVLLASCGILITGVVAFAKRFLDRKQSRARRDTFSDLSEGINLISNCQCSHDVSNGRREEVKSGVKHALLALKREISELVGDERGDVITDACFLEFCEGDGQRKMLVKCRAENGEIGRARDAREFMAYPVALQGRVYAEHDFKGPSNPYPNKRLTGAAYSEAPYRSILYLPVVDSVRVNDVISDSCIGVISLHSPNPYQFWRWGDHKKVEGRLGDIAFEVALPYISVIRALIKGGACRVSLEVM